MAVSLLFALVVHCAHGHCSSFDSQRPNPIVISEPLAPRVRRSKRQRAEGRHQLELPHQERGTEVAPVVVRVLDPPNTSAIAQELLQNRVQGSSTNWLNWTFNGLLVLVGAGQVAILIYTARVTSKAANAAKTSAEAAEKAALVAERTLISGQRAWVTFKAMVGGPLTFDQNGASASIAFEITNLGPNPASNVYPHVWMGVNKHGDDGPSPHQELRRRSLEIRKQPIGGGHSLFAGESFPDNIGGGLHCWGVNVTPDEIAKGLLTSATRKHLLLYVFGFIDYTFATDPTRHHQTGFIFELRREKIGVPIGPDDKRIEAAELTLVSTFGPGIQPD
jgi:hypothetical protein